MQELVDVHYPQEARILVLLAPDSLRRRSGVASDGNRPATAHGLRLAHPRIDHFLPDGRVTLRQHTSVSPATGRTRRRGDVGLRDLES